jgi:hypothetical protein
LNILFCDPAVPFALSFLYLYDTPIAKKASWECNE